jgi:hypothetical protein
MRALSTASSASGVPATLERKWANSDPLGIFAKSSGSLSEGTKAQGPFNVALEYQRPDRRTK